MTPGPEYLPPLRPEDDGPLPHSTEQEHRSYVVPEPELPLHYETHLGEDQQLGEAGFRSVPGFFNPGFRPEPVRFVPSLGHAAIFFIVALFLMGSGEGIFVWIGRSFHLFGNASWSDLAEDARLTIPSQALEYLAIFGISTALFGLIWHRPFLEGICWRAAAVRGRVTWLVLLGVVTGVVVGFGGNFLPMPKDAPIVHDMINTTSGAWLMFLFSFTGAALMEELAFRGFLLPSLKNWFRWMNDRGLISAGVVRWIGIPVSVLLTSLCFALLHGPQVSHSWAPVLLIGVVSVVLCIVRLRLDSVFASAIVHAAYNFTLFAGMLITTDAFRHLERLKN